MMKSLESLTPEELRAMVLSLEAQLCDLYAVLEAETATPVTGAPR